MANENLINRKETKIVLRDGKEYTIRPLTIDQLIDIWPLIQKLEKSQDDVSVELLVDMKKLVAKALGSQVTEEDVGSLVDLVDTKIIISAIVGQSANSVDTLSK